MNIFKFQTTKGLLQIGLIFFPAIVFGQNNNVFSLVDTVLGWVQLLIPVAFALALLLFFVGLVQFMLAAGDSGEHAKGRNLMIWGVITLFVMASIWGLVGFLQSSFGVNNVKAPTQPSIEFR